MTARAVAAVGGRRRGWLLPAALVVAAAVAAAFPATALEYRRTAVAAGELHRLLTCHWVHWSADHLAWDLLALLALGWCCRGQAGRAFAALGAASVAIPLAVASFLPRLETYRGLSGLDSALFVLAAVGLARGSSAAAGRRRAAEPPPLVAALPRLAAVAALVLFALKVGAESAAGAALFADSAGAGYVPVPLAHLVGGICGAAAGAGGRRWPAPRAAYVSTVRRLAAVGARCHNPPSP